MDGRAAERIKEDIKMLQRSAFDEDIFLSQTLGMTFNKKDNES